MESLSSIVSELDDFFALAASDPDPAFARFLPSAYEGQAWQTWTEPSFAARFNGLMLRGSATVRTVFWRRSPVQ